MQTAGKLVNLYESENELSKDDFTARRIAEECINYRIQSERRFQTGSEL